MKKFFALLLAMILVVGMLAGCNGKADLTYAVSGTVNGESRKFAVGPYRYYVQWMTDYYYAYIMTMAAQANKKVSWTEMLADKTLTAPDTLSDYIVTTAKEQYMTWLYVELTFDALGLKLDADDETEINRIIQEDWVSIYGNDGFNTIRQTLGLTYDEFRNLMACNLKSQKIIEYYYGEGGPNEVTLDEMKEYYANNFVRFKYIVLMTQDSKGNKYGEDKMNEITNNKATIMAALENKTSTFEDLIVKYSDDYTEITTDMTSSEKEAAEKQNKTILEDGLIIDSEGVFDKNLATYYNVVVDSDIVDKVFGMKNGEFVSVKLDDSIWIIQRYANDEKAEYFEDVKEMTYQALYQDDFAAKHTDWRNRLNYVYNEAVIDAYKPENLADLFDFATKGY